MDVKYISADWEKMRSSIGDLIGLGRWGKGMIDELKDITNNLQDVESDISTYDSDRVISFNHVDRNSKYQSLFQDFKVLHKFSGKVGDIVDRTIDHPFYEDIDAFVETLRDATISNYTTENRIGATEEKVIYAGHGVRETYEIAKKEVSLDDILSGDNFYSNQMKLEYEAKKEVNPDQEFSQEEYQLSAVNTRAFEYESIKNKQHNEEFWGNIFALGLMVSVSIFCPPAGLALGIAYGTLEAGSAITGKDWISGRELDTSERWIRGALAPLDLVPGVAGIKKFSGAVRTANQLTDMARIGTQTGLRSAVHHELNHVGNMIIEAGRMSSTRLRKAGAVVQDVSRLVTNKLKRDAVDVAILADKTVTATKNLMPGRPVFATNEFGKVRIPAENTHRHEKFARNMLNMSKAGDVGGSGGRRSVMGQYNFESTRNLKGFKQQQLNNEFKKHNITMEEFNDLRLKPVSELTDAEVQIMKNIRNSVPPVTQDTLLQKTIPIEDIDKYLSGDYKEIGGYVAKVEDVANATKYDDIVESLRLDYTSWDGTTPYPKDGDSYAMIRFKTNKIDKVEIPYGERFGGSNPDGPPCTQNGFTGSRNGEIVPEWEFNNRYLPEDGAELYRVIDGEEKLVAIYDEKIQKFSTKRIN